jgi:hypothetical protein
MEKEFVKAPRSRRLLPEWVRVYAPTSSLREIIQKSTRD